MMRLTWTTYAVTMPGTSLLQHCVEQLHIFKLRDGQAEAFSNKRFLTLRNIKA